MSVENIENHGASPNPDDPGLREAVNNMQAFNDACAAAGTGGTVYIPGNQYYIGEDSRSVMTAFGRLQPAGISIVGDGPEQSLLGVTEHMDNDRNHNLLRYSDTDHGTLEFRDIRLEGNYENLDQELYDTLGGARGVSLSRSATIDRVVFRNVWFRGQHLNAVRGRHFELDFERCTFEEVAIGVNQDSDGSQTGQPVTNRPPAGTTTEFRNCKFLQTSGNAVNFDANDGTIRVLNCYIEGAGSGCFKHSAGGRLEVRNVYAKAQSDFLKENLPVPSSKEPFYGRHFFKRLTNNGSSRATLVTEDVEFHTSTYPAFYTYRSPVEWRGDNVAIYEGCQVYNPEVFYVNDDSSENESGYQDVDIGRLSVHNSDGSIFNMELDNSSGTIGTLHRDGNTDGLGYTADVSIDQDVSSGDPFEPDVPSKNEVGIATTESNDSEDEDGSSSDEPTEPLFEEWSPRRISDSADFGISETDGAISDTTLTVKPEVGGPHALSYDVAGKPADVDVVTLCRIPSDDDIYHEFVRMYVRGDDSNNRWGWTSVARGDNGYIFRIRVNVDGSIRDLNTTPVADTAVSNAIGNWFFRRFRADGDSWRLKAWDLGDPEPDDWDAESTDNALTAGGWVGTGGYPTDEQQFDWFSVATDGGSAQIPETGRAAAEPNLAWETPISGETVSGTVPLRLDASDADDPNDSLVVEYQVGDSSWSAASYSEDTGYYEAGWDSTTVSNGEHTLTAEVSNSAGQTATASVDVTVENTVKVVSVDSRDVTETTVTLVGDLTSLGGAEEVDAGFEWRERGADSWHSAGEQTLDSTGEYAAEVSELEAATEYEFRAVLLAPNEASGETLPFTTVESGAAEVAPVIEQFDIEDRSNPAWNRYDVDWRVSHDAGDLDTVVTKLRSDGVTVDAESTSITGDTASFSHIVRVRGDVDEIRLAVNDAENRSTVETKEI